MNFFCRIAIALLLFSAGIAPAEENEDPIRIVDPPKVDFSRSDGGLARALPSKTFVVWRGDANIREPNGSAGWTYHHHPDIACWKGKLYVAWDSCRRDEDTWPSKEIYSTSLDGEHWSWPRELFPQGSSTALRMYFFHAPNGKMLAIAGLRVSREPVSEDEKGGLLVREIRADHSLGDVFILRRASRKGLMDFPTYDHSSDGDFVDACRALLKDHIFLEQQDHGLLLDAKDRIRWDDPAKWKDGGLSSDDIATFGKAMCFYRREDGGLVGIGKRGWVTTSADDGATWSQPMRPKTLIAGMGKVWGERTASGKYILIYNPDRERRWPLVIVSGNNGRTFGDMRVLHGELPAMRYPGKYKVSGASYVRGIGPWASDHSRNETHTWVVFSLNKEEIWVCRIW